MRKDVRYGLGIGALALAFAVTFLVVRNHTRNQLAQEGEPAASADPVDAGSPEANPAPPAPTGGAASNAAVVLPPLAAVPGGHDDIFAPRPPGPAAANPNQDWETILETGHAPGAVAAAPPRAAPAPRGVPAPLSTGTAVSPRTTGGLAPRPQASNRSSSAIRTGEPVVSPHPLANRGAIPTAAGPLTAATGRAYVVRPGDTFVSIAKAHYGQSRQYLRIEQANPGVDPGRLKAGQSIVLPDLDAAATRAPVAAGPFERDADNRAINPGTEYRVEPGDSLYRIATRKYQSARMVDAIYDANRDAIGPDPQRLRLGMILKLPQATASSR